MLRRLRTTAAVLAVAGLLAGMAGPARAGKLDEIDPNSLPPMVDLMLLRPLGLVTTIGGAALFVPVALMTAMFHPTDIAKPFNALVKGPAVFTFGDPLGSHGEGKAR